MQAGLSDSHRLFLALWPDPAACAALQQWQALWPAHAPARKVAAARLHLTLHFIGSVAADRVADVVGSVETPMRPSSLAFGRLATWAGGLAVLELLEPSPELSALHAALAERLQAAGLPVEQRPFHPHVTLARRAMRPTTNAGPLFNWRVADYALVRSLPGGTYQTLRRYG